MPTRCYRNTVRLDKKCGDSFIPDDAECHEGGGSSGKGGGLAKGLAVAGVAAAGVAGAAYGANKLRKKGKLSRLKQEKSKRNIARSQRKNNTPEKMKQRAATTPSRSGATTPSRSGAANTRRQQHRAMSYDRYSQDDADIKTLTLHLRSLAHNDSASIYDLSYAQTRLDKKCGDSYIPDDTECHEGGGSSGKGGGKLALGLAAAGVAAAGAGGAYAVHKKRNELNKGKDDKDKVDYSQAAKAVGGDIRKSARKTYKKGVVAGAKASRKAKGLGGQAKQAGADIARGTKELGGEASTKTKQVGHKAKRQGLRAAATVRRTAKKARKTFSNNELNEDAMYPDVASLAAAGQMMLTEPECGCYECRHKRPCSCA